MIEGNDPHEIAAFFDLDLTITDTDSLRCFLKEFYINNHANWRYVPHVILCGILRKLRLVSLQSFKERSLVALKGMTFGEVQQVGQTFCEKHLFRHFRKAAVNKIEWHKKMGNRVFIVTSSPDVYLNAVNRCLGGDGYEGSILTYQNGKFTGRFKGNDCLGKEKATRINALAEGKDLNLERSFAYSDHESDLPMLNMVGNPVPVSPTENLERIAKQRSWKIENW